MGGGVAHEVQRALGIEVLSAERLDLGVRYGLSGRFEGRIATAFQVRPDAGWSKEVALGGALRVFPWCARPTRLVVAPSFALPLSVHTGYDVVSVLELGADARVRLADRLFVIGGRRLLPVDLRPAVALSLELNAGVGVQATTALGVVVETQLMHAKLIGQAGTRTSVADRAPLSLGALYATGRLDVTLSAAVRDAFHSGDGYSVALGLRMRNR